MTSTGGRRTASGDAPRGSATRPDEVWERSTDSLNRWVAGDLAGLDDLVAAMTPVLWHVVRSYRLPEAGAEDVVRATWLALVNRWATVQAPVAVGAWLTTTARREAWRVSTTSTAAPPVDADMPTPRLWAAVDELPEGCRRLLRIVAFEDRPDYRQLATDLGIPVGSIGTTRGRCLARLRVVLMQAGEIMNELGPDALLAIVRRVWEERDPVPDDLVTRMQGIAAIAAAEGHVEPS